MEEFEKVKKYALPTLNASCPSVKKKVHSFYLFVFAYAFTLQGCNVISISHSLFYKWDLLR